MQKWQYGFGGILYPLTCKPADVMKCLMQNREWQFFGDVQVRGAYPSYMGRTLKDLGITLDISEEDLHALKETVDFVSFSYMSGCSSADENEIAKREAISWIHPPTHTQSSEWGWQRSGRTALSAQCTV
jgi:6-phospho-beta-glucosidase